MAMYNAIEDANKKYSGGVDALITPKSTVKLSGLPPLYWKWNVTVKGIRLITSEKNNLFIKINKTITPTFVEFFVYSLPHIVG